MTGRVAVHVPAQTQVILVCVNLHARTHARISHARSQEIKWGEGVFVKSGPFPLARSSGVNASSRLGDEPCEPTVRLPD